MRFETDTFGEIAVADDALWGAQTQRALTHFAAGRERMPVEVIHALALAKWAAAQVNRDLGRLDDARAAAIMAAAEEVIAGEHMAAFPLSLWQSGSGTQSHMNMNEVLANRGSERMGGARGVGRCIHPNDHVNLGQSSNDMFPTAMHVAGVQALRDVVGALEGLTQSLHERAGQFAGVVKVGRTHGQDAVPISLGQEFSGYAAQLGIARQAIEAGMSGLLALAVGGTAVGTGLNTHPQFGAGVAALLSQRLGLAFVSAPNKFAALAGHEPLVVAHGALKALACALNKIANDIRWMSSGPRAGLAEIFIPQNEPGSSIMPGKVNPTQCELVTMVCCQVFGNDAAITHGAAAGQFELNVFKPLIIHNFLHSARLLADAMGSFAAQCVRGIKPNAPRLHALLQDSLMMVTALNPHIGYDAAAKIARRAAAEGLTLRTAALDSGLVTEADFDRWVRPESML